MLSMLGKSRVVENHNGCFFTKTGESRVISLDSFTNFFEPVSRYDEGYLVQMDLEFLAISVDEGILGAHDESLKFAKSLCKKLGFALMIPSNHHKGA